ncbi:cell division protein FtsK [Streptomyces fildesensis]|uniref:cell division protein FtsK n=1 Tax=Streptomyces fildesensis TaxID=375757 RepID=UPI0018E026F2|nr:cell division protein FtsK [Streptomyces fildesensis]
MNHDDENELFNRLEHDLAADSGGELVDLDKARAARDEGAKGAPSLLADEDNDTDEGPAPMVDTATSGTVPDDAQPAVRRPVVPDWARDAATFKAAVARTANNTAYAAGFHAVRSPLYVARIAGRSPRGMVRLVGGAGRWATDAEGAPMRAYSVRREDAELYLKLSRKRDDRVRARSLMLALAAVFGLVLALVLWVILSTAQLAAVGFGAMLLLGLYGRPADRPLITRAVSKHILPRLTSDQVEQALLSLGIGGMGRGEITFPDPIRQDGPGWRATVDLPRGVTAGDIMERRKRLASGLRRPLGTVWPEGDADLHEGRLVLWVGDRDIAKQGLIPWPLAGKGRHDIFRDLPFGVDPRGRAVSVPIVQHNWLFGSQPGQGKTSSVRVLVCGASLDPSVELWLHENKGTGDLDTHEPVSHRFVSGIDDESIAYAAESLALLRKEVMRRGPILKGLPRDICPDKRVTRQIADMKVGLHVLLAIFDECQNVFAHPKYGKQAGEDAEFIIKVGRALGVVLVLATQRPDKDSLPTGISGNVSIRFCLKVAGQVENDMILGTSAYKNGVRATTFRPEVDAGIGYLAGALHVPTVVRTAYLDTPAAEAVAVRALAMRKAAGTITGHAAGETTSSTDPTAQGDNLLDDLVAIWPAGENKVWSETLTAALALLRPDVYTGWGPDQLVMVLKPRGIRTVQVGRRIDGKVVNRRGVERDAILGAVAERDRNRDAG